MKNLFPLKLKQASLALLLFTAGLFAASKANATCTARILHQTNQLSATFSDSGSSAITSGHAHATLWSFGDGSSSASDNPHHTYSANGTYTVCITIFDSITSCTDSTCVAIYVSHCTLTPTYTYTVSGKTVTFTNTTTTSGTTTYIWVFGDGTADSTSGATVSHTYTDSANDHYTYLTVYEHSTTCIANGYVIVRLCAASARISASVSGHSVQCHTDSMNGPGVTYSWHFGDGNTSTSASPNHTYSSTGHYTLCLTATDSATSCTSTFCTMVYIVDPTYCISGNVTKSSNPSGICMVYLVSFNATDSSLTALDSFLIHDSNYTYHFCGLSNGTYYTKAALLSTNPDYSSYIPTYYGNATNWASATAITISSADVSGKNIAMTSGTNTGGPGFIGGLISAGANKVGDPVSGILIILYDANNKPVAYTHTGADGKYSFSNLPYGTYKIYVEIPGKTCIPATVTLDADTKKADNVNMSVNKKSIVASAVSGISVETLHIDNAMIYPNPVSDKLIINTNLQTSQRVTIQVSDITGKIISTSEQNISGGLQVVEMDASTLHNGTYFVKMQLQKDNKILEARFVKAQ